MFVGGVLSWGSYVWMPLVKPKDEDKKPYGRELVG
jgi:hypothetical protein